ncbi:hypothetical protein [Pseudomonas sp. BN415]|nr:hypothetical protein [Pseudomonas sp. BN415]
MQDHHEPTGRELLLTLLGSGLALVLLIVAGNTAPDLVLALIQRH